jgi:hypothetical protein
MTETQLEEVRALTLALHSATLELIANWERGGAAAELVHLPGLVVDLARADAAAKRPQGHLRFDLAWDAARGSTRLLEIQAGNPSGMGMQHAQVDHFGADVERLGGHCESLASSFRSSLVSDEGNAGFLAFVISRGAFVHFDQTIVCDVFRSEGMDCAIVAPEELALERGVLFSQGRRVSCVVRDSLDELLAPGQVAAAGPLLEAWSRGTVRVCNAALNVVADHKVLLSLLDDEALLARLTPQEAALVRGASLRTRLLRPELLELARGAQQMLVLKPSDGYGGFGVVVGPQVSTADWCAALLEALGSDRPYVLQDYAQPPVERFPVPSSQGGVALESRNVVLSTWTHRGLFGGLFARVHSGCVVNVHQGGGLVPVCVIAG